MASNSFVIFKFSLAISLQPSIKSSSFIFVFIVDILIRALALPRKKKKKRKKTKEKFLCYYAVVVTRVASVALVPLYALPTVVSTALVVKYLAALTVSCALNPAINVATLLVE